MPRPPSRRPARLAHHAAALLAACVVMGCAHADPLPPPDVRALVPFVEDGHTTMEQALLELGMPSARFEGERILTWRLSVEGEKLIPVSRHLAPWGDPRTDGWKPDSPLLNLVLVFDERHVLARHALLRVR